MVRAGMYHGSTSSGKSEKYLVLLSVLIDHKTSKDRGGALFGPYLRPNKAQIRHPPLSLEVLWC